MLLKPGLVTGSVVSLELDGQQCHVNKHQFYFFFNERLLCYFEETEINHAKFEEALVSGEATDIRIFQEITERQKKVLIKGSDEMEAERRET